MKNKKNLIRLLRLLVSAGLLSVLYWRVDSHQIVEVFRSVRIWPFLAFFALLFVNTGLHTFKWSMLLRADGIHIPFLSLLASYLVGSFFNLFLPSNIGGDAYRVYDVACHSKRTVHAFASVLADRITGYLALAIVACVFGLFGARYLPHPILVLIPIGGLLALVLLIGLSFKPAFVLHCLGLRVLVRIYDFRPLVLKLLDSVLQYRAAPLLLGKVMLASFAFQILVAISIFLLSYGLQIPVSFYAMIVYVPFVSIFEAVPITIFGLGIRDASYTYFLVHAGVSEAQALTLPLAYVALTLIYVSIGGVIFLLRPYARHNKKIIPKL